MHTITSTITMSNDRAPEGFPAGSNAWKVELRYQGRRMTVPFYTGPALGEPTTGDVLECLVSDASSADQSFEDWCSDYGYDTDSRRHFATYQAVVRQTAKLRRLLGDDFKRVSGWGYFYTRDNGSVAV